MTIGHTTPDLLLPPSLLSPNPHLYPLTLHLSPRHQPFCLHSCILTTTFHLQVTSLHLSVITLPIRHHPITRTTTLHPRPYHLPTSSTTPPILTLTTPLTPHTPLIPPTLEPITRPMMKITSTSYLMAGRLNSNSSFD